MSNYFLRWNKLSLLTVINLKDILSELLNVKQNKEKHINFWKSIFGVDRIAIAVDRKKGYLQSEGSGSLKGPGDLAI